MPVPTLARVIGIVIVITGAIATAMAISNQKSWITPLIPVVIGAILFVCGQIAAGSPGARKHAMHAAAAVSLLGALGSARGPVMALTGNPPPAYALVAQSVVLIGCVVFLVFAIKSFIDARKARTAAA